MFSLFAPFSDEFEVFFPKYSQTAILHAAHFQRVVNNVNVTRVMQDLCRTDTVDFVRLE